MLNSPVSGSRTWMCTIAAPARAASMAAAAICSGVIGQCGLLVTRVSSPVMAQVMMTSEFMAAGPRAHGARPAVILSLQQYNVPARHGKPRSLAAGRLERLTPMQLHTGPLVACVLAEMRSSVRHARQLWYPGRRLPPRDPPAAAAARAQPRAAR